MVLFVSIALTQMGIYERENMLAICIETQEAEARLQTIAFPTSNDVIILHRTFTGERGRGQTWRKTEVDNLPTSPITKSPCAVVITGRDMELVAQNQFTNLGVRATSALDTAQEISVEKSHREAVEEMVSRIYEGDMSLNDYLVDKRYSNGVAVKPIQKSVMEIPTNQTAPTIKATPTYATSNINEMVVVPDIKWSKEYVNRKVGGVQEFDIYDRAMMNHENILIEGHAGSGKTMSVIAYASARGYRYYNVSSHIGLEASQLFGKWIPTADGHFKWQDGAVSEIVRNGGVLLLNEINFIPERVSTVLFSLLDDRREIQLMDNGGEVIKAHPQLLIVGDMNPNYRGTRPMNQAWKDRFHHVLEFPYEISIERKLLKSNAIITMANQLRTQFDNEEITTPISTRSLVSLVKNAKQFGIEYAIYSYTNKFEIHERNAVKLVCDTHKANMCEDLGLEVEVPTIQNQETTIEGITNEVQA
jgi:MoxR-like ATPase